RARGRERSHPQRVRSAPRTTATRVSRPSLARSARLMGRTREMCSSRATRAAAARAPGAYRTLLWARRAVCFRTTPTGKPALTSRTASTVASRDTRVALRTATFPAAAGGADGTGTAAGGAVARGTVGVVADGVAAGGGLGRAVVGAGARGTCGADGTGVVGTVARGTGADGTGVVGTVARGTGADGTGVVGTGVAGTGAAVAGGATVGAGGA